MWGRIYAFALRHIFPLKRDFDLLSDMLYWPIIDVILWGITGRWLSNGTNGTSLITAILMGLLLWNVIWRSQSEVSRNLIDEIWNHNLVNLFSTPLSVTEWIMGVLMLSIAKLLFTITMLTTVVYVLYAVNFLSLGWWLIPFFICAVMTGWWVGFIAAGIVIRWGPKVQTVVWTLPGILLPFSAVYFPLALLPTVLRPISYLLPSTYVFESMRSVLVSGTLDWRFLAISFAMNCLYLLLALLWFRMNFKKSLALGLGRFD
jgi:ABC-2 type transport system permease protein